MKNEGKYEIMLSGWKENEEKENKRLRNSKKKKIYKRKLRKNIYENMKYNF